MTSTTRYLENGVRRMLLRCSLEVVGLGVGVETVNSKVSLSPPTLIITMYVSFFWSRMPQTMLHYAILTPWGTSLLWMKNKC